MKVAVTSVGKDLDSMIDERFGRSSYFIIVDTDSDEFEVSENEGLSSAHGTGVQAAQFIVEKGIQAIITGNIGPNAIKVLKESGIDVFTANSMTVRQALANFSEGKLEKISGSTTGQHNK
ncbi:Dinitrogenase iron-molybdenum cofactor biosynthesis protein [Tepidanaerobacter acetatoxydans Re1]|uniref:Dinitrogenase iron-molybdenum cofactor biosynthesis protein n=1 Tax=Tepidanaerobacter acetatoxydans (strain DSM 21804 / JCM 16047 / Re1) TaxID=1209989 RepID=F4LTC2_TEPAE|nr:NifB/NifX family molybdenum-iron cluster-binding protein [Tepidanaerobacter acetatoxydans]AEE90453.1 Dinitrogenase iron-molybdenum cofactor biosynthesis protein [Tepidanaerobacter acetatoxydans Re1]CCP24947.1 Dinitrogenase iron-molybdenum cofactor biosynthesis protein [Tepidanaerobacter acetatoxydans Re1]